MSTRIRTTKSNFGDKIAAMTFATRSRSRRKGDKSNDKLAAIIFVFLFVLCSVFLVAKSDVQIPAAGKTLMAFMSPFQNSFSWLGSQITSAKDAVVKIQNLQEENKILRDEVETLRAQNLNASESISENQRLRALLGYKQSATQFDLVAASIIGRESATWSSVVVINRGTMDGVADQMAVVTELGLVGHIMEAGVNTSKVQLILDPRSSVGTLVQRADSRVAGIVSGDLNNPTHPKMSSIPKDADVQVGDMIVTSGFGGVYPKGIIVGRIAEIHNDEGGLLKHAIIDTSVNFEKLEDVAVIINSREAPPEPLPPAVQSDSAESDPAEISRQLQKSQQIQRNVQDDVHRAQQEQLDRARQQLEQNSGGGDAR